MKLNKYILLLLFFALVPNITLAQDSPVLTFNIPTQNTLQFNRFLMNPNFSVVREEDSHLTLYHRNQWIQFDDSPELYMLSYSGRFGEHSGVGIGIYQQNLGIITSFGGIGNFSYRIQLYEKIFLSAGFNLAYYTSGVNRNRAVTNEPDPLILSLTNNSLLTLKPGINITMGSFDVGFYAENLVDYDFKSSEMVKDYSKKTYSGHIMYHHQMNTRSGIFEDGFFRLMFRGKLNPVEDFKYGGSVLLNFPYLGWIQTGIDDYYGISIGAGGHLTNRLSLGYVYERVINDGLVNLGPTHEITLSFRFPHKTSKHQNIRFDNSSKEENIVTKKMIIREEIISDEDDINYEETVVRRPSAKNSKVSIVEKSYVSEEHSNRKSSENLEKEVEIEKLRMTLDENHTKLLDMLLEQESVEKMRKEDFENRIKNMTEYIERLERTIAEKADKEDCNCVETTETTITTETITSVKPVSGADKTNSSKQESKQTIIKTQNTKNHEDKQDLASKLASLESPSEKNSQKFSLTDEEIKEYYSKLTTKQRATAKRNFLEVPNQEPGFYIIANVFSEPSFADQFLQQLKKKGVKANYFINPKNNFRYVYIKKYNSWNDALISYYTNVDNTYFETIWIMNINIK